MPSIDFRTHYFNDEIQIIMKEIQRIVHRQFSETNFGNYLFIMRRALMYYYQAQYANNPELAEGQANNVFSQYCQNLVYYICHNIKNEKIIATTLDILLTDRRFLYYDGKMGFTVWVDPKENTTFFQALVRNGHLGFIKNFIDTIQIMFDTLPYETSADLMSKLLTLPNKNGFNTLHTVADIGHAELAHILLTLAKKTFGGKNTSGFKNYLIHQNDYGFTPLNSAARAGNAHVTRLLLHTASEAFLGKNTLEFKEFLEKKNCYGDTALNSACLAEKEEVVELLCEYGADPRNRNMYNQTALVLAPQFFKRKNTALSFFNEPKRQKREAKHLGPHRMVTLN